MMDKERARKLLDEAGVFFYTEEEWKEEGDEPEELMQMLNMNDVWGWGCSDGEYVSDDELPVVAQLFVDYGWCGILYWVSEKNDSMKSEFHDNNRFIEFVRNEERIKKEVPDYDERGYHKTSYMIGEE